MVTSCPFYLAEQVVNACNNIWQVHERERAGFFSAWIPVFAANQSRVVPAGIPNVVGKTLKEKYSYFKRNLDDLRAGVFRNRMYLTICWEDLLLSLLGADQMCVESALGTLARYSRGTIVVASIIRVMYFTLWILP